MPPPFQRLSVPQFAAVLQAFPFSRRVTAVHMHHTWRPDHSMWRGAPSVESMWRVHTQERGFADIAQHLTIDPEGFAWTGRHWNAAPASAKGHNGTGVAGPFMIEIVGNFDKGCDPFAGAQRQAVLDVIKLVQRHFGLDAEALLFHNQAADKSCPGSSIDRAGFVAALRAHVPVTDAPAPRQRARKGGGRTLPLPASALADDEVAQRTLQWFERTAAPATRGVEREASPLEELDYSHDSAGSGARSVGAARSGPLSAEEIDALRPHVINLRQGVFSSDGAMTSDASDVESILFEHAARAANEAVANGRPFRLLLYAHGGLVKESTGLRVAQSQVGWWRDNGVYPIHFVWETGLFETLRDLLVKTRDAAGGARNVITDHITDPLLEAGVRAAQAPRIWGSMKSSAEKASAAGGGARLFVERLAAFCKAFAQTHGANGGQLELHAVGHSAGSIFMAHLLDAAAATRHLPPFTSLHLMAPAIRADAFKALVAPLLGAQVGALTLFTMRRDFERDDNCALIYRKSLLYLVAAACEPEGEVPILGLEDSLRADPALRAVFGLAAPGNGHAEVVWSRSAAGEGRSASRATTHGGFDDDAPTMESVARRVLALDDLAPLPRRFPAGGARSAARDLWADGVDWPAALVPRAQAGPVALPAPGVAPSTGGGSGAARGRKRALCVGIDTYPSAPLAGCVNDARLWQQTLQSLGFEVDTLFNEQARREPLASAIERLLASARAGDEVVLQFAGHGTQAPDLDGDEAGGDTPGIDEALCPHDFADGMLLLDDDLGAMIDRVAPGVHVTIFMDCCHSGTNTRAAPVRGGTARSVTLSAAQKQAFLDVRRQDGGARSAARGAAAPASNGPVEASFAACQSSEKAWESNGHGEFTLHATRVLRENGAALTPDTFYRRVVDAFGTDRRQTPQMTAPPERLAAPLLGASR